MDIGNFFLQILFMVQKPNLGNCFLGLNFFLTFELKLVNSISLSFGKTVKRLISHFSQTLAQMAALGISQFLSPKSKNRLSVPVQISNIVVKIFQHGFRQSDQIRVSYYFDIGNFFYTNNFTVKKPNLGKLFSGPKTFS